MIDIIQRNLITTVQLPQRPWLRQQVTGDSFSGQRQLDILTLRPGLTDSSHDHKQIVTDQRLTSLTGSRNIPIDKQP